ncbi:hypothetical protein [Mycobacteroides salmoniphilum]|uniref:Prevent-host-death family protein n=1 Tax=Mycobacteroides salmoniphilum TaxID=404941 RepID=A0A4R8T018_9MYCO|nr:hypothetical protein [Mycobacteroides salmoniphilum]TEA09161.1 hypothetical protein CCUG60884_00330 [Mycobacteroides salmoniphilum]
MGKVSFSSLQLHGKETLDKWLGKPAERELIVQRRGAEDLVLTTAARAAQAQEATGATVRIMVAMFRREERVRELVADVAPDVFPWVTFLPQAEIREFVDELVETLRAAESINNPAPVAQVIAAWRNTAQVWADPEVSAALATDSDGDYGSVPLPAGRE